VGSGHAQVADRQADRVALLQEGERLGGVVEGAHWEARFFDGDGHRLARAGFVVDNDDYGILRHGAAILAQAAGLRGNCGPRSSSRGPRPAENQLPGLVSPSGSALGGSPARSEPPAMSESAGPETVSSTS